MASVLVHHTCTAPAPAPAPDNNPPDAYYMGLRGTNCPDNDIVDNVSGVWAGEFRARSSLFSALCFGIIFFKSLNRIIKIAVLVFFGERFSCEIQYPHTISFQPGFPSPFMQHSLL